MLGPLRIGAQGKRPPLDSQSALNRFLYWEFVSHFSKPKRTATTVWSDDDVR